MNLFSSEGKSIAVISISVLNLQMLFSFKIEVILSIDEKTIQIERCSCSILDEIMSSE